MNVTIGVYINGNQLIYMYVCVCVCLSVYFVYECVFCVKDLALKGVVQKNGRVGRTSCRRQSGNEKSRDCFLARDGMKLQGGSPD